MYIIDRGHSPKARSARSHIIAFFWTDTPSKLSLGYYYVIVLEFSIAPWPTDPALFRLQNVRLKCVIDAISLIP